MQLTQLVAPVVCNRSNQSLVNLILKKCFFYFTFNKFSKFWEKTKVALIHHFIMSRIQLRQFVKRLRLWQHGSNFPSGFFLLRCCLNGKVVSFSSLDLSGSTYIYWLKRRGMEKLNDTFSIILNGST